MEMFLHFVYGFFECWVVVGCCEGLWVELYGEGALELYPVFFDLEVARRVVLVVQFALDGVVGYVVWGVGWGEEEVVVPEDLVSVGVGEDVV